jgi:hypothetical protein
MKEMTYLPERVGFRFVGITLNGEQIPCVVWQDYRCGYYILREDTGDRVSDRLEGWYSYDT